MTTTISISRNVMNYISENAAGIKISNGKVAVQWDSCDKISYKNIWSTITSQAIGNFFVKILNYEHLLMLDLSKFTQKPYLYRRSIVTTCNYHSIALIAWLIRMFCDLLYVLISSLDRGKSIYKIPSAPSR